LRLEADLMILDAMLTVVDPYRMLQVVPDAEPEVIQAAYRALARKHHPDVGGSEMQMAMLNAAWETLRDQGERARYDLDRRTAAAAQTTKEEPCGADQRTPAPTPSPRPMSARARSGTVLDFGRYAGFSLGELAVQDRNYLEWLERTPMGRRLQQEIDALLTPLRSAASRPTTPRKVRGRPSFLGRR
jgi:curved DNA-binding protein CbpA